jgi:hypothetical protein
MRCCSRSRDLWLGLMGDPANRIPKLTAFSPARAGAIVTTVTATSTQSIIPKPSVPTTAPTKGESVVSSTYILAPVRFGLFSLSADFVDIGEKLHKLF